MAPDPDRLLEPRDYSRDDCDDLTDALPYPDIDARCFPTAPLFVAGNVPGAMLWSLAGADGDCGRRADWAWMGETFNAELGDGHEVDGDCDGAGIEGRGVDGG